MNEQSQNIESLLRKSGVAVKQVHAYGSQLVVTCYSQKMAEKAAMILQKGTFRIRRILEALDEAAENKGTCMRPTMVTVWRVFATV